MASASHRGVLTREELDALLAGAAEARRANAAEDAGRTPTSRSLLDRQLEEFAVEQSRLLSTQYQKPIRFQPLRDEELRLREFADSLLPLDRVVCIPLEAEPGELRMVLGRGLFYEWLTLAFGGMLTPSRTPIPDRDYTRIELRLLRRIALELAGPLAFALGHRVAAREASEVGILDLGEFEEGSPADTRLEVRSFEVLGLGDASRLRLLLPARDPAESGLRPLPADWRELPAPMLEARVRVSVEAGVARLSLGEVAALRVGDSIPLDPAHPEGLLVRVEDEAKFAAIRGVVGDRVAVQLGSRILGS